jgi:uncharacterized protein with HEPN domain
MRNYHLYIKDILDAIEAIEEFVKSCDSESFKNEDLVSSAVIRKFEIIGEAAKNVPDEIRNRYAQIPWKEMAGMRDRLIHSYFGIKYELVWNTIKTVFPSITPAIRKILDELEQPGV